MQKYYLLLAVAIAFEIVGTICLKKSDGFQNITYALLVFISYICSFTAFGYSLKEIPVSIAYAIWCSLGISAITLISAWVFKEQFPIVVYAGLLLIIIGVLCITLFSDPSLH